MSRTYEQLEPVISALDERIKKTGDEISELKEDLSDLGLSVVNGTINITYEEVSA